MSEAPTNTRAGFVALAGRPNVGKSTLMNALIRYRLSIVTPKPQTTRHAILGIATRDNAQMIFVDTPGIHNRSSNQLNRRMNRSALSGVRDADLALFIVVAGQWTNEDQRVLKFLSDNGIPAALVVNKIDLIKNRESLLPFVDKITRQHDFAFVMPVSARKRNNLDILESEIITHLPESEFIYEADALTNRSDRFVASEIIREKLTMALEQELPYTLTVEIENYEENDGQCNIGAVIWVERESHKKIVIGKHGAMLKKVGIRARKSLQEFLGRKVDLRLWVKVKESWADDENLLRRFGYED